MSTQKRIQITRLALTHARKRTDSLRNSHVRLENRTRELRQRTAKQRERNFHLWRKVDQNGLDTERVQDILQHYRLESAVLEQVCSFALFVCVRLFLFVGSQQLCLQEVDLERNAVETVAELRDEAARILSEKQVGA